MKITIRRNTNGNYRPFLSIDTEGSTHHFTLPDDCFECAVELDTPPRANPVPADNAPLGRAISMPPPLAGRALTRSVKARPFMITSGVFVCFGLIALGLATLSGHDSGDYEHNPGLASRTLETRSVQPYRVAQRYRDATELTGQEQATLRPTPTPPMGGPPSESSSHIPLPSAGTTPPPSFGMPG